MRPRYGIVQSSQKRYQACRDSGDHLNDDDSTPSCGWRAMIDPASLIESARSVSSVGFVLAESLVLYAGYGVLFDRVGSNVKAALEDE